MKFFLKKICLASTISCFRKKQSKFFVFFAPTFCDKVIFFAHIWKTGFYVAAKNNFGCPLKQKTSTKKNGRKRIA